MYLNKIYYSDGQYGIKTAAKYFYNKELNELSVPQIAFLAGLPQHQINTTLTIILKRLKIVVILYCMQCLLIIKLVKKNTMSTLIRL